MSRFSITTLLLAFFSFTTALNAQTSCVSLAGYDASYLQQVTFDNVTYPPGTAFITSGYISYVKPGPNNFYQYIQGDTLMYIGNIDIDVSAAPCTEKILTFSAVLLQGMAISGDTIFYSGNPPASFQGNGFTMSYDGQGNYTITGNFDVVSLFSSTNFLFNVCLECVGSESCVSLAAYDETYLQQVSFDNVTYPPGTAFITSGDISYVKPGPNNFYQFIQGDTLMYVGDIDIDVSASPCAEKVLTFSVVYLEGLAIDGDTIFSNLNPPLSYVGNGFTMTQDGQGNYTVTGDFDVVSLFSSTNFLFNVCLECVGSESCVSLAAYDETYLQQVSFDNVTYPPGTAFITSGDISYVKPGPNNFYQFIQGDTLMYVGDIDIDVSASPCAEKVLTFSVVYLEGLAIDGDTIFSNLNPPLSYVGNGFTMTQDGQGNYTVTGDFDVVSLFSSTNFLFNVCLSCGALSLEEVKMEVRAYPNPVSEILTLELAGAMDGTCTIYGMDGREMLHFPWTGASQTIDMRDFEPGVYLLVLVDRTSKASEALRIVKN